MKKNAPKQRRVKLALIESIFDTHLLDNIRQIHSFFKGDIFLTGGTVRDLLMNRHSQDIDLTVSSHAKRWACRLAVLIDGTYVPLGRDEDSARVVWKKGNVDFSSFREGSITIEEDLMKRDFTINSLAVPLNSLMTGAPQQFPRMTLPVLDPTTGIKDLRGKRIRSYREDSFSKDPLRLLRLYRFASLLNVAIDSKTNETVRRQKSLISQVAIERITHELDLIMASKRAGKAFAKMAATGLLWEIIPELQSGLGVQQPPSHHLDVFEHNLATLSRMEKILSAPGKFFPQSQQTIAAYLANKPAWLDQVSAPSRNQDMKIVNKHSCLDRRFSDKETQIRLKWAALLHDLGKPSTFEIKKEKGGRITFYHHDKIGAAIFKNIGQRLKWSNKRTSNVAALIFHHMRPFHLLNVQRQNKLSLKACLRFLKTINSELAGIFLLSMADAMAGQGSKRPVMIEQEIATLLAHIEKISKSHVVPVRASPPLLTGNDLIEKLSLVPGPVFKEILCRIEDARLEKKISTKKQALAMAVTFLESRSPSACGQKKPNP